MTEDRPEPVDLSPEELSRQFVRLVTSRGISRELAHEQIDEVFPDVPLEQLPIVARNLRNTVVGFLEFLQALRDALHEESPEWDDYFDQIIRRFALDQE